MDEAIPCLDCGITFQREVKRGPKPSRCPRCSQGRIKDRSKDWRLRRRPNVPCSVCGVMMWSDNRYKLSEQPPTRTCNPCRSRRSGANRADRAAARRAAVRCGTVMPVSRRAIFERDGWRCQICRRKIDPSLAFPHPRSASLDHIIPVSAGGTHEPKNVQLACLSCNCRKGAGAANDQLRLIG